MESQRPAYVASLDSSTSMLVALANFIHGRDFPALGFPRYWEYLLPLSKALPRRMRQTAYTVTGWGAAVRGSAMVKVDAEEISGWVTGLYPRRRYPAVFVGSPNGALVHLCAAVGAPWLPQTFLIPVRQTGIDADDLRGRMRAGARPAAALLRANPGLSLHHMADPIHDRPQQPGMNYFRIKFLRLGDAYERFIEQSLEPGGRIVLVECECRRPVTLLGERHVFQAGGEGGATLEEIFRGGERVERFLEEHGSDRRKWDPPAPNAERPEAEWGFEPALGQDVRRFARDKGYRLARLVFPDPHRLSPVVADLYRWWYRRRGQAADRLLVEMFFLLEPYWALRTGSVPYWAVFNTEPDLDRLAAYLDAAGPYDSVYMMLLSTAIDPIGMVSVERWRQKVVRRARKAGGFVGVDEAEYPLDLASLVRYHTALRRITPHYPLPDPLPLDEVTRFVREAGGRYGVQLDE